jgi:hypothetical protein
MNIDTINQRDLDMNDGVRPWTRPYTEMAAIGRWGHYAWARNRKRRDGWGYDRVIGCGGVTLGRGRTWEEAWKKAIS